jgi:hypothetical protein
MLTFLNKKEGNEQNEQYISILQIENNAEYNKNLLIWVNFECCCILYIKYYRIYFVLNKQCTLKLSQIKAFQLFYNDKTIL